MRRLRKSVKALIISLVSVVCVAAIVLGCVFGLRDNGGGKPNLPPVNAFDSLGEEINSSVTNPEYEIFDGCPYEGIELAGNNGENVILLCSNYFIIEDEEENQHFYTFRKKPIVSGYEVKELTAKVSDGGFVDDNADGFVINAYNDEYVVIENSYSKNSNSYSIFDKEYNLIYFGNFYDTRSIYNLNTFGKKSIVGTFEFVNNICSFGIIENYNYEDFTEDEFSYEGATYIFKLDGNFVHDSDIVKIKSIINNENSEEFFYEVTSNAYVYAVDNKLNFINFENFYISSIDFSSDKFITSVVEIAKNKFFVEYEKISSLNNVNAIIRETDNVAVEYVYSIYDISDGSVKEQVFKLNEGYVKATAYSVGGGEKFYYIVQQKASYNELVYEFLNNYYSAEGNLALQYSGTDSSEPVKFYKNYSFVTKNRILKGTGVSETIELFKFSLETDETNFKSFDYETGSIVVFKNGYAGILSCDGKYIVDPDENKYMSISPITNGYGLAEGTDGYKLIDVKTSVEYNIKDYYYDENLSRLTDNGYDFFLKYDEKINLYSLNNFKNEVLIADIKSYDLINLSKGNVLIFKVQVGSEFVVNIKNRNVKFTTEEKTDVEGLNYNDNSRRIQLFADNYELKTSRDVVVGTINRVGYEVAAGPTWEDHYEIVMKPGYFINGFAFSTHKKTWPVDYTDKVWINTTFEVGKELSHTFTVDGGSGYRDSWFESYPVNSNGTEMYLTYYFVKKHMYAWTTATGFGNFNDLNSVEVGKFSCYTYFMGDGDSTNYDSDSNKVVKHTTTELTKSSISESEEITTLPTSIMIGAHAVDWRYNSSSNYYRSLPALNYGNYSLVENLTSLGAPNKQGNIYFNPYHRSYYFCVYEPNIYEISFNLAGGSFKAAEENHNVYLKYNVGLYLDAECSNSMSNYGNTIEVPTKFGYNFLGFYTSAGTKIIDGNGFYVTDAEKAKTFCSNKYDYNYDNGKGGAPGTELIAHWEECDYRLQFSLGKVDSSSSNLSGLVLVEGGVNGEYGYDIIKSGISNDLFEVGGVVVKNTGGDIVKTYKQYLETRDAVYFSGRGFSGFIEEGEWRRTEVDSYIFDFDNAGTINELLYNKDWPVYGSISSYRGDVIDSNAQYESFTGVTYKYTQTRTVKCTWYEEGYSNTNYVNDPKISVIQSNYIFDGWAYYNKANNKYYKINLSNNPDVKGILRDELIDADGTFTNNDSENVLILYATYKYKNFFIQGENAPAGASYNISDNVDTVNKVIATPEINWKVEYQNEKEDKSNLNKDVLCFYNENENNDAPFKYGLFNNIKDKTPKGGTDISLTLSVNSNLVNNNSVQMYQFKKVVLENFVYHTGIVNGVHQFASGNLVLTYNGQYWEISGIPICNIASGYYYFGTSKYPNEENTYNYIQISSSSSTQISLVVYNCMLGSADENGNNPGQSGEYGFKCVAYIEPVYTSNDTVNVSGSGITIKQMNVIDVSGVDYVWIEGLCFEKNVAFNKDFGSTYQFFYDTNGVAQLHSSDDYNIYCEFNNSGEPQYLYYSAELKMTVNSTQLIAITPDQSQVKVSSNVGTVVDVSSKNLEVYELNKYLSSISVGFDGETPVTINGNDLKLNRILGKNADGDFAYGTIKFGSAANTINVSEITYYGKTYVVQDGISLKVGSGGKSRTFILYIAREPNTNFIMYFLYSDINNIVNDGKVNISLTFSNFEYEIQTNTNFVDGDKYRDDDNAIITNVMTGKTFDSNTKINPSDLYTLSVAPANGYLINTITITFKNAGEEGKDVEIFSAKLKVENGLSLVYDTKYHFMTSGTSIASGITYDVKGSSFVGAGGLIRSEQGYFGINYAMWNERPLSKSIDGFETLFFIIGGIYNNIKIDVELVTYAEFDFKFEDLTNENSLNLKVGEKGNADLGNLKIAYIDDPAKNSLSPIYSSEVIIRKANASQDVYRVIFLGNAGKFRSGYRIYATGFDYSFAFKNGQYYENNGTIELNSSNGFAGNELLLSRGDFNFVIKSGDKFVYGGGALGDKSTLVSAEKYLLGVTVTNYINKVSSTSYLEQTIDKVTYNQIDNTNKKNTWFNDVVLSNINYAYYASQYVSKNSGDLSKATNINWQSYTPNGYIYNYEEGDPIISAYYGYGVVFTYYEIPGYFLKYINLNGQVFDIISYAKTNYSFEEKVGNFKIYVKYYESTNETDFGKFEIKFYKDNALISDEIDSLNMLLNNISIKFYSAPYSIKINYNVNNAYNESTKTSTDPSLKVKTETFKYDSMIMLEEKPEMTGYTFIGWGSQYAAGQTRIDKNLIWNSSSLWSDPSSMFEPIYRDSLLKCIDYSFNSKNKKYYDFYVKDGYFITDNGSKEGRNYNFWLANATAFTSTIGHYETNNAIEINLYAIWKANTYRINLNLNDYGVDTNTLYRGSTNAYLSKGNSEFARQDVGSVINAGNLYVGTRYYAYVTFDQDDWYITTNEYGYKSNLSGNLLDIIVDRYGYSWLGFTSEEQQYLTGGTATDANRNSNIVFASQYNKSNKVDDTTFNNALYEKFAASELENEGLKFYYYNQYNIGAYKNTLNANSVVFYMYAATGVASKDYLNSYTPDGNIACFDTSLTYDSYSYVQGGGVTYRTSVYRGITLYAYWQANEYKINIDFRDKNSTNLLGSSTVEERTLNEIKSTIISCYFDDATFAEYINKAVPIRVGYDFVGWSFRFDGKDQDAYSRSKAFLSDNYLNASLLNEYNNSTNKVLFAGSYNDNYLEKFGDKSGEDHNIYIYAIWRTQKFTINFSLNISGQTLANLYDKDSNFALALYNSNYSSYAGIEQNFLKNTSEKVVRENAFNDIVANVVFTATFDDEIGNSYFDFGGKRYLLKDLFASSAGYYFIGWMYHAEIYDKENNSSTDIVVNGLKSIFDEYGYLDNNGTGVVSIADGRKVFNYNFYTNLFNTNFKLSQEGFSNDDVVALTFIDGHGVSTNFGYVELNGKKYYIAHEYYVESDITKGRLYYLKDGEKHYVIIGTRKTDGSGLIDNFTFTDSVMYYLDTDYIIRFVVETIDDEDKIVSYYIDNNGIRHDVTLRCAEVDSTGRNVLAYFGDKEFVATTTRQFTLYAKWEIRIDLEIKISNGNNGDGKPVENQTSESNFGLAGYYHISDATASVGVTTTDGSIENSDTQNYYEREFIEHKFGYFNNLNIRIIPYFNGRYLSEMKMTYHAVEWVGGMYVRVPYTLTVKFTWINSENIMTAANISSISVLRFDTPIGFYELSTTGNAQYGYTQTIDNADGSGRLTLLDRKILEQFGFVVNSYANDYSYLDDTYGRRDVNKVDFDFENVGTDIEIVCKFSIQTFEVDIYNLFDDNGNTLEQRDDTNVYDTAYLDDLTFQQAVASSSAGSFAPLLSSSTANTEWKNSDGTLVRLATIPTDVASGDLTSYNVPYGYFMYGVYYGSRTQKPTDKSVNGTLVNIDQEFNGYEYIYSNGYYNAGRTDIKLQTEGTDSHISQCSPLLGSSGSFQDQSIILNLAIYTFFHWFEYTPDSEGNVILTEYDEENGESKYINRNIKLYGYYYTQNKPTSVEFYTWDKDNYYYTEIDTGSSYVLNDNIDSSPFKIENGIIQTIESRSDYVDENGYARIKTYKKYGVNQVKFDGDNFKIEELDTNLDMAFINKLLKTYWYMQESYDILYFILDGKQYYVKFNTSEQYFYYENEVGLFIKINSINSSNMDAFSADIDGKIISLEKETHYVYDFYGSKMYVKITRSGTDRYYELKEVTDEEISRYYASAGAIPSFVTNSAPRYYVDIENQRYYMMLRNRTDKISADTLYDDAGGFGLIGTNYTIENIDEYYILYNEEYTKINYEVLGDGYINPYIGTNSATLMVEDENGYQVEVTLLFDYERKQLTQAGLDEVYFEYELYKAVNDNYSVSFGYDDVRNRWQLTGITISRLPSPNSGFWYHDSTYGFVSFIKFTSNDLSYMKDKTVDTFNTDRQSIYSVFVDYIDNRRNAALADVSEDALADLKNVVSSRISEYTMRNILNNLIGVSEYVYDNGVIKQVIANIPINFNKLEFTIGKDENGEAITRKIDITVSVKYLFEVVRPNQTKIDDNVYAVPIYSPYVMQFNKAATKSGTTVVINTEEARVSHFEVGSSVHIYNDETDPINFVVLNSEQYNSWISSSELPDGKLTKIIANKQYETRFGIQDNYDSKLINFDFAGLSDDYYIVMFYYKYNAAIPIGSRTQVTRVGDDVIKVTTNGGFDIKVVDRGYTD